MTQQALASDTTIGLLWERYVASADMPAVRSYENGGWKTRTWREYTFRIAAVAQALRIHGIGPGDRVTLFADTCLSFAVLDLAAQSFGAVVVCIHPAFGTADLEYALGVSEAKLLLWHGENPQQTVATLSVKPCPAYALEAFVAEAARADIGGKPDFPGANAVRGSDLATILFTSGTSGTPKGVCLTHTNLVATARAGYRHVGYVRERPHSLHWLPFAHILGRIGMYLDIVAGSLATYGRGLPYLSEDIAIAQPHVLFVVPKALERFRAAILKQVGTQPAWKQALFHQALRVPHRHGLRRIVRGTVFAPVLKRMGGQLDLLIVGGAPTDPELSRFFENMGIAVREGYGLTETTGPSFIAPYRYSPVEHGTVGIPIETVQYRLLDDGELHLRGESVFGGYLDPRDNESAFTKDGWFRTGDLAEESNGNLRITGRKKDILITRGGENIAPEPIENVLTRDSCIADALVVGDDRPYLVALLCTEKREHNEGMLDTVRAIVEEVNMRLPAFQKIHAFAVLPEPFRMETGDLTPTLKKKRRVIEQRYRIVIDRLYETGKSIVVEEKYP